jgi:hypothetical protein
MIIFSNYCDDDFNIKIEGQIIKKPLSFYDFIKIVHYKTCLFPEVLFFSGTKSNVIYKLKR